MSNGARPVVAGSPTGNLTAMFLGTSTVLVTDGDFAILVDGYFSRPMLMKDGSPDFDLLVEPDVVKIDMALARAGIDRLDLVVVSHSHIDHALDSPLVAQRMGARLAGSSSTRMIAQGYGIDVDYVLLESGVALDVGPFHLTPIAALHSDGDVAPGEITSPLTLPASAAAFKTGGCFDFHLQHPEGSVLIHPTANFIEGALKAYPADTLYLGVGGAGAHETTWRRRYWRETVEAVGARVVRPIHWEQFWEPIDQPFKPFPPPIDDFAATTAEFDELSRAQGIDYRVAELWAAEPIRRR